MQLVFRGVSITKTAAAIPAMVILPLNRLDRLYSLAYVELLRPVRYKN